MKPARDRPDLSVAVKVMVLDGHDEKRVSKPDFDS